MTPPPAPSTAPSPIRTAAGNGPAGLVRIGSVSAVEPAAIPLASSPGGQPVLNEDKDDSSDSLVLLDNETIKEQLQMHIMNEPPDGGRDAWLVVLASFLAHFVVFGIQYSFGVYQSFFVNNDFKSSSPASVSLIGTVGFAAIFCVGIVSGKLAEAYGYKRTIFAGTVLITSGLSLPLSRLMVGLGSSLVYYPSVSVPSQWWKRRRSFATGIAVAGSGLGSLTITAVTDVMCALPDSDSPPPRRPFVQVLKSVVDFEQFKNPQFVPLLVGVFMNPFGYLIPFYFIPSYIQYLGMDASWGPLLLNITNALSIVGRILIGFLADHLGNINSLFIACISQSVACLCMWLWFRYPAELVVFAVFFGFVGGGFVSLMPTVSAQVCGVKNLASTIGLVYSALSVGHLAGPPLAALLVDTSFRPEASMFPSGGYAGTIIYSGVATLLASMAILSPI
ncbi:major facilitator superfamily domain-containing protein [Catenaria anguillulae PL171]|uniref:Major facilitator superfamily domain-containing protein n=1 Tax=Catenaria anguillulae PL171 TaxID=765915 RepID=A0A1Y2HWL1_9FUNG|nr:major facilitator superfamily domain-containing protein [Catenaria anguillulae PL171]